MFYVICFIMYSLYGDFYKYIFYTDHHVSGTLLTIEN